MNPWHAYSTNIYTWKLIYFVRKIPRSAERSQLRLVLGFFVHFQFALKYTILGETL